MRNENKRVTEVSLGDRDPHSTGTQDSQAQKLLSFATETSATPEPNQSHTSAIPEPHQSAAKHQPKCCVRSKATSQKFVSAVILLGVHS